MLEQEPKQTLGHVTEHVPEPELSSPSPRENPSTHPIHPTSSTSTPERMTMDGRIRGRCPACASTSLFVGAGGYVTCSWTDCPDPSAPSRALGAMSNNRDLDTTTVRPVTGLVARDDVPVEAEVVEEPWDEWLLGALQPRLDESDAAWAVAVVDAGVRSQLVVELERMEGDLGIAVHEATTARAEIDRLTAINHRLVGEREDLRERTEAGRTALPNPASAGAWCHAYGVQLAPVGEDGEWLALGHIEPRRMVAAMRLAGRSAPLGLSDEEVFGDCTLVDALRNVRHRRALFTVDPDEDYEWYAHWDAAAEQHPLAHDVTVWA